MILIIIVLSVFTLYTVTRKTAPGVKYVYVHDDGKPSNEAPLRGWEADPPTTTPDHIYFYKCGDNRYTIEEYSWNAIKGYRTVNPAGEDIGYQTNTYEDAVFNIDLLESNL